MRRKHSSYITISTRVLITLLLCLFSSFILHAQNPKIDSLLTLLKTDKADTNKVKHLILISWLKKSQNPDTAILLCNQALHIINELSPHLKKQKTEIFQSSIYCNIGVYYAIKSDYSLALDYYLKALNLAEKLNHKRLIATSLNNIGPIYDEQGNYPKALDYYLKTLKIKEELKDKRGTITVLGNIGTLYSKQLNHSKALIYFSEALRIAEEFGDKEAQARNLGSLGITFLEKKEFPKALDYLEKSLLINNALGNKMGIANNMSNIGTLYVYIGKYKEAEEYLVKSIAMLQKIGADSYLMVCEASLSSLYDTIAQKAFASGQFTVAAKNYKKAILHYKKSTALKDSVFSQENKKEFVQKEMNFEFEKKEAITKAENEKQSAIAEERNRKQKIISFIIAGGLFLALVLSFFIFRSLQLTRKQKNIIELQKNEVYKQKQIVEEKQKQIVDSINYANRIQKALLTSDNYIKSHLHAEHFILFKPKDIVSGDFYWALSLPPLPGWDMGTNKIKLPVAPKRKNTFYLATADCTGHGVPGAFMSMLNISYLNENIVETGVRLPHDILNLQRKKIIQALNPEGSTVESKDGMDCVLCVYDFDKMLLHFAAANNSLWLIRNGELTEYKGDKMPVGKYQENIKPFTLQTIELLKGDIIYTSTDGFADQFGSNGKKLMKKNFKAELLKIHNEPMNEQKAYLDRFFDDWKGITEQVDDVCVVGIRI